MYVHAHLQGKGVGRALAQAIVAEAKRMGYALMRLDTSIRQIEAQRLYRGLGFLPPELRDWLVFMELRLSD